MIRVDIEGQFDHSNPSGAFAKKPPFRVNRQQLSLTQQPSNWNNLCDEIDKTLAALVPIRRQFTCVSYVNVLVLIACSIPVALYPESFFNEGFSPDFYLIWVGVIICTVGAFVIVSRRVNRSLRQAFDEANSVCSRYGREPGGTLYEIQDEWWGGCAKRYSKRRFLIVNASGVRGNDVEQLGGGDGIYTRIN
jgi:hypothetical protein